MSLAQDITSTSYSSWDVKHLTEAIAKVLLITLPLGFLISSTCCDIGLTGIGLCFLSHCVITNDTTWIKQPWFKACMAFWLYICISSFASIDPAIAFYKSITFVRFPIFTSALANWLLPNQRLQSMMIKSMTLCVTFASIDLAVEYATGTHLLGILKQLLLIGNQPINVTLPWEFPGVHRLSGISNKLNIGGKLTMILPPVLVYLAELKPKKPIHQWALRFLIAFLVAIVPLTGERSAVITVGLSIIACFICTKHLRKEMIYSAMLCLMILSPIIWLDQGMFHRHTGHIYSVTESVLMSESKSITTHVDDTDHSKDSSAPYYRILIDNSWQLFLNHPWLGVGIKQMATTCQQEIPDNPNITYDDQYKFCPTSPANIYLELLTITGIIGFGLFMNIIYHWCYSLYQNKTKLLNQANPVKTSIIVAILIAWGMRFFPFIIGSSIFFSWYALTIWWLIGWMLALTRSNAS